jgi:hypothetical protein
MHNPSYVVTGTITDENTVKLDEALPPHLTKVRVTIEPLDPLRPNRYIEVMAEIRKRQKARNHQPSSSADVGKYLNRERDSWE